MKPDAITEKRILIVEDDFLRARSVAELARAYKAARRTAYGVRNVGRAWEWRAYAHGHSVARGREPTSFRARVAALANAVHFKTQ